MKLAKQAIRTKMRNSVRINLMNLEILKILAIYF